MKNARLLSREGAFACFSASVCVSCLCCTDVYDQQSGANGTSPLASASVLPSHYQASARLHDFSLVHIAGSHVYEHVFTLVHARAQLHARHIGLQTLSSGFPRRLMCSPPPTPPPEMIELDGDEERISSQGRYAERDIVQVCPLSRMSRGMC